jgi:hypothetical protein
MIIDIISALHMSCRVDALLARVGFRRTPAMATAAGEPTPPSGGLGMRGELGSSVSRWTIPI